MPREASNLNPEIQQVKVGVRKLREIDVYPLSVGDQFKMSDILTGALQGFVSATSGENADLVVASVLAEAIKQNLGKVLALVIDEKDFKNEETFLADITNNQLADIAVIVYETNYAPLQKKIRGILEKVGLLAERVEQMESVSPLRTLSPPSLDGIPDTVLETSTDDDSEMEV